MSAVNDLAGRKFGRILVTGRSGSSRTGKATWDCVCECGNKMILEGNRLTTGNTKSCGCLKTEMVSNLNRTHGMSKSRLYKVWVSMNKRCSNPNDKSYPKYGGRGIRVCEEWSGSFTTFKEWAESHGYHQGLSIDRMNNGKDYSSKNCRWTTRTEQNNNTSANVFIDFKGKKMTFAELGKEFHINPHTLRRRLYIQNLPVDVAVLAPVGPDNRHKNSKKEKTI